MYTLTSTDQWRPLCVQQMQTCESVPQDDIKWLTELKKIENRLDSFISSNNVSNKKDDVTHNNYER